MADLLTSAQMRAIEGAAIASGRVTGLELMERAGRGVVEAIFARWPGLAAGGHRAVVLCGPGNNGGDGYVVARLLRDWGWEVEVFAHGPADRLPADAAACRARWLRQGEVRPVAEGRQATGDVAVVVDALFGTGLARPLDADVVAFAAALRASEPLARVVAVDILSGICADSGRVIGASALLPGADLTVTFHRAKLGHVLAEGGLRAGHLSAVDLGLGAFDAAGLGARVVRARAEADVLRKDAAGHKYRHGHALVLCGPAGRGGAARLAARGALRIGAGLVTLGCESAAMAENAARLDAVMLREVKGAADLRAVLEDRRINAVCVGPGLGVARAAEMLAVVLAARDGGRAVVIDADGLTALAEDGGLARHKGLAGELGGACVLTPHGGEFARLFPDIAARLEAPALAGPAFSKVDALREAAGRAGCVVLLKGADTVIAAPDGRCAVSAAVGAHAAPWLATAGSGDVLAGFVAGLLARGVPAFEAASAAAALHLECARAFGPGLIAEDLPEALPGVLRAMDL